MPHLAVRVVDASKRYENASGYALKKVSVDINEGEFVFLTGPSGSGKSTLIRICLREERTTGGTVEVLGHDIGKLTGRQVPYLRRHVGAVFQDYRLLPGRTVAQNVAFALEATGQDDTSTLLRVSEVLELVGLDGKSQALPGELSGGEQQRVAIARALVGRPSIILADEPTGNLDPETSAGIVALLDLVHHTGTTVIVATHDAQLVDARQQRVIRLEGGSVVSDAIGGYRAGETA